MALLDMVGLTVTDLASSIRFYRLLGVDVADPDPDEPYAEAKLPSGLRLSWNHVDMVKKIDPDWQAPSGSTPVELAFLCESPADVDRVHDEVVAAGHASHKAPWDAFWGQRYAVVVDPDGNHISLFCPLER